MPLINRTTGEYAVIDSINEAKTEGTLDIDEMKDGTEQEQNDARMRISKMEGEGGDSYYVLIETGGGDSDKLRRSPAIQTMSKVTGLTSGSTD